MKRGMSRTCTTRRWNLGFEVDEFVTGPVSTPNPQHMNSILESQRYGEIRHILPDSEGHLSPQKSDSQNCEFGDAEDACGTLT